MPTLTHSRQITPSITSEHLQLQIIYDLTLLLQAAPDVKTVEERVLSAVTQELGFPRAALGLIEPGTEAITAWSVFPAENAPVLPFISLPTSKGLLAQALKEQNVCKCTNGQLLDGDGLFDLWLAKDTALIFPLALREHAVGALIVVLEGETMPEERLTTLQMVAGQAAVALGTTMLCIDRARQLAIEQERNRIARDIHDTVAQSMFGMVFSLDACINMLPAQAETVKSELLELLDLASQVRAQMRHSIFNIWPSKLTLEQFQADIHSYVTSCAVSNEFRINFVASGDFDSLPPAIRRNLYRVTQEALANAARYAGVDEALVHISVDADQITLRVEDRGIGFDPRVVLTRAHNRENFGLHGIRERIETLGGECAIRSQPGEGTEIAIHIPLDGR